MSIPRATALTGRLKRMMVKKKTEVMMMRMMRMMRMMVMMVMTRVTMMLMLMARMMS